MRYKEQPSLFTKCATSSSSTITYFRKRPIAVIVLIAVFLWIIIAFNFTSSNTTTTKKPSLILDKSKIQKLKNDLSHLKQPMIDPFDFHHLAQQAKILPNNLNDPNQHETLRNKLKNELKINSNNNNNNKEEIHNKVSNAKKVVVTYGQNCCTTAKKRMCNSAFEKGNMYQPRDECHAYDASVMDEQFSTKNQHILSQGRGAGYWLWKPYIIYKWLTNDTLEDDNSYLIYSDAGAQIVGDVGHVLRFMEENDDIYRGVLFFGVGFDQKIFCKRDAFILQDCDRDECYNAMQINAFSAFFRKCDFSRKVVKKWLDDCQDERILTDTPNTMGEPNLSGFRDHRHDQAAITNIMIANGWKYDTTNGPILDKVFHHDRFKA